MENVKIMSIRFPKELHWQLRHRSIDSGISVNQMVITALRQYLDRKVKDEKASAYL